MHTKINLANFIPLLAVPAAVLMPTFGLWFSPYTVWILGILLFFSFLGLGLDDLMKALKEPAKPFYAGMIILIVTPLVIYPIMQRFFPDYLAGAFIFMLLPSAVSAPAVAAIYGGDVALTTVTTVLSNLLSPFTITLFLALFIGTQASISPFDIFFRLAAVVLIPFILGLVANRFAKKTIEQTKKYYRVLNLSLLFLFFFAALAPYGKEITSNLLNGTLWLAVLIAHLVLYFFAKLLVFHVSNRAERVAITSNLLLLNVGLGVMIAQNYFGPKEMLFIIFCEIVWVVLVGTFKYFR